MVLEVSTLIAMLFYGLIAWAVERIIFVIFYRPRGPVTETTLYPASSDRRFHRSTAEAGL
jgi:hypothetical protein